MEIFSNPAMGTQKFPIEKGKKRGCCCFLHPIPELRKTKLDRVFLEFQTTSFRWMFGSTTISYVKNWNHPIETTV